jgi:hypothetical protein
VNTLLHPKQMLVAVELTSNFLALASALRTGDFADATREGDILLQQAWDRLPDLPRTGVWTYAQAQAFVTAVAEVVLEYTRGKAVPA